MAIESTFQGKVRKWLKDQGCYVLTISSGAGIPDGCPDIVALAPSGRWVALECKASATSKFQPLQKLTIAKLDVGGYAKAIWPANWDETKIDLLLIV